jgi:hypothetical protein
MNRRSYAGILALIFLISLVSTACGGGSGSGSKIAAVPAIAATSGTPQSAAVTTAFSASLVATVTTGGTPTSGVVVTFTAPSTGASGTFAGGANTATTDANGVATSAAFTANTTAGAYTVTASTPGATAASFHLTNTAGAAASITATAGTPQTGGVSTAFSTALAATVLDSHSNPVSGATVTFTAPTTGASGTFAGGVNTATTNASGMATAAAFTANATAGGPYTVTASVAGVSTPADFSLTNTVVVTSNYSFYLSGLEAANDGPNYYALAGAVTIDSTGKVLGGKQDYNDGFGFTSPQPAGDTITGGTLTVDPTTGQGTLSLITNNTSLGVHGTETLGVQFVNTKHALIVQFDGSATSSGSIDYQTLSTTLSDGNYAFTLAGVDSSYLSIVFGGVFSISNTGTTLNGTFDVDDAGDTTQGTSFAGTVSSADSFGRGTITHTGSGGLGIKLNYYIVGPEAIRIIDVDPSASGIVSDSAVGSAFSQGAGTFTNSSLGSSVFSTEGSVWGFSNVAAGMFTVPTNGTFTGVGDDDEVQNGVVKSKATIAGTYSIASNGYGSLTITPGDLGGVSLLGLYMTDPALNLNDPNNTTTELGGALLADLDPAVSGTGVLIPQSDTATASFAGNYAFGAQVFNDAGSFGLGQFDFAAQGAVTSLALTGTGLVSDPFSFFSGTPSAGTDSGVAFSGTAVADSTHQGRYTIPLVISTGACSNAQLQAVIYQASGGQLLWMNTDTDSTFFGLVQQKGSLTGLPAAKKKAAKKAPTTVKPNC